MDTRMIDVAIGLVLVFALFGLLASALHEMLASVLKSRGKNLRVALASLLGDEPEMAAQLMQHPLLVSMAEGPASSKPKPSYLNADVFVAALLSKLNERVGAGARPPTPAEFITGLQADPALRGKAVVASMAAMLPGAETQWPLFEQRLGAWFDAVGERSIGWYKRKTQRDLLIIGFVAAAVLNVNPLVIGPRLWNDAPLRAAMVGFAQTAHADAAASAPTEGGLAGASSGPTAAAGARPRATPASLAVEQSLAQLQTLLQSAATSGRADATTAAVFDALAQIAPMQQAMDTLRTPTDALVEQQRLRVRAQSDLDQRLARLNALLTALPETPLKPAVLPALTTLQTAWTQELEDRKASADPATAALPATCDAAAEPAAQELCRRMADLQGLRDSGLPIGWSPPHLPTVFAAERCDSVAMVGGDALAAHCRGWGLLGNPNVWIAALGWLLTGIGATLGAPFWFDLLGRLVTVRGAGGKPDSAGAGSGAPGATASGGAGGVLAQAPSAAPAAAPVGRAGSDALNAAEFTLSTAEIRQIQSRLQVTTSSGYFDSATRTAIADWQRSRKAVPSGELSAAEIAELLGREAQGDPDGYVG